MKRFLFLVFLFLGSGLIAQQVVDWKITYNPGEQAIILSASIEQGWHLYSQHIDNNVGPVPTTFTFKSSNNFQLVGQVEEPNPFRKYDENFEATLDFFENEVSFKQKLKPFKPSPLEGTITYMVCNDAMCLPPVDYKYKIEINL